MEALMIRTTSWDLREAYFEVLKEVFGHPDTEMRLKRAYDILTCSYPGDYEITIDKIGLERFITFSVKGPNDTYKVIPSQQSCSCPDSAKLCKHRLAVKVLLLGIKKSHEHARSVRTV